MATTPAAEDAVLRRLTEAIIESKAPACVDTAVAQGRPSDRYHRLHIASRRAAGTHADSSDISAGIREYALYLGKGACIMLAVRAGPDAAGPETEPTVRLVHVFGLSRPGMSQAVLLGEAEVPGLTHLEWYPSKRPASDIRLLAARALGPLPPELRDSLLPPPTAAAAAGVGGGLLEDASALASHAFAHWLAGLPLPQPHEEQPAAAAAAGAAGATAASGGGGVMASLTSLFNRVLGRKKPEEAAKEAAAEEKVEEKEEEKVEEKKAEGGGAGPKLSLEEAWSLYEQRVREREAPVYGSEVEREWFEAVLGPEWEAEGKEGKA